MYGEEMVTISEITVFSERNEIFVRGKQHRNHLNFESAWYINNHELNRLLNELQRINSTLDVVDLFSTYQSSDGTIMQLTCKQLEKSYVQADWLDYSPIVREIRA